MTEKTLRVLLESVRKGEQTIDGAIARLRTMPFEDIGFAKIDHHRSIRCGFPEVIYCEGKSPDQVAMIFDRCAKAGANVLATRASHNVYHAVSRAYSQSEYNETARTITLHQTEKTPSAGSIAIVTAGTSDLPGT